MHWGGFDESDQAGVQIATPFQLLGYHNGQFASAEDQDILRGSGNSPSRVEAQPREQNEKRHQNRADEKHPAPDEQIWKDKVDHPQQQATRPQRLAEGSELLVTMPDSVQVVQIAVVEADLEDAGEHQPLPGKFG